jgi:hypothetical protein
MRPLLLSLGAVALLALPRAAAFDWWNDTRHSALLPDARVTVRTESPSGAGAQNFLLYAAGGVQEEPMASIADGPSTVQGTVPGPSGAPRPYGFRLLQGGVIDFMPVRLPEGAAPAPGDLTRVATDPTGDEVYGLTHLDLVDCRVSVSSTRLYASLRNAGGGFPVNSGLTFYGYLMGIADPAVPDPDVVFALMYTYNQPGIIGPGLYKVTGTGLGDLAKIGEITVQTYPGENSLVLSCSLADLLADPHFASWYDPADPCLSVAGFTQRITLLGGANEADRTPGGNCYLREFSIAAGENGLPVLEGLTVTGAEAEAVASVVYADADGHCPVLSEIVFDGVDAYPMFPQTLDYGAAVLYATAAGIPPLASGEWDLAVARFSDNGVDVVEAQLSGTAVPEDDGRATGAAGILGAWPNPSAGEIRLRVRPSGAGALRLTVLDAEGRVVAVPFDARPPAGERVLVWDGRDRRGAIVPAGRYICVLRASGVEWTEGLTRVR